MTRDIKADYIKAYLYEYRTCKTAGLTDRADAVARELKKLGHDVEPPIERAVPEPLETAVEKPKRGRPKKVVD